MLLNYLLACLPLVLTFCVPSYALRTSQNNDPGFHVEGVVLNSVTGKPIPRVLVQLSSYPSQAVLTGPEGEFSFQNVPATSMRLTANKPGYLGPRGLMQPSSTQVVLVGPETKRVVLKLAPEAIISGTVVNKNEEPMEGLQVEILGSKTVRGYPVISPLGTLSGGYLSFDPIPTGADGSFRIPMLPAGKYYVAIKCQEKSKCSTQNSGKNKEHIGYPPVTYYPDVVDFDAATAIEISSGQHVTLSFLLKQVPVYSVSGTVNGVQAFKFVNAPVLADTRGQMVTQSEFNPNTGAFAFEAVPDGSYKVLLTAYADGRQLRSQSKLSVDGPLRGLSLAFAPPQEIPVIVHKELSKPVSYEGHCTTMGADGKSKEVDCADIESLILQLVVAGTDNTVASTSIQLNHGSPGQGFSQVMPGHYYVVPEVGMWSGYLASLRCGGVDLLRDELVVPEEGSMPPIEAVLRNDWAAVNIQMRSDAAASYGWAVLLSKTPGRKPIMLDMQPGVERSYANIPPGEYTAFIVDTDQINLSDEASMAEFAAKGTSITLMPNTTSKIFLDLIRQGD
jgi:hypothetical protein